MNLVLVGLPVCLTVVLSGKKAAVKICPTSYIGIVAYASKSQAGAATCIGFLSFGAIIPLKVQQIRAKKEGRVECCISIEFNLVW